MLGYKVGGCKGYYLCMFLKVVVYSYLNNIYFCCKMEKVLRENINYMWFLGK